MPQSTADQRQFIADFYRSHREELVNFATSRLGNREEGEDLVQDAFVKMMAYDGFINAETVKSFAFTIVANKVKDLLRRRIYRRRMEESRQYEAEMQCSPVERIAEYHDTLSIMQRGMRLLSPACSKVYRMSFFHDMTAGAIAEALHVSQRTVEAQVFSARKKMRAFMRKEA